MYINIIKINYANKHAYNCRSENALLKQNKHLILLQGKNFGLNVRLENELAAGPDMRHAGLLRASRKSCVRLGLRVSVRLQHPQRTDGRNRRIILAEFRSVTARSGCYDQAMLL